MLVSAADKLYNASAILQDYRLIGPRVWERFKRGRKEQLWYFRELIRVYQNRCHTWRIVDELKHTVDQLDRVSAGESADDQVSPKH